MDWDIILTFGSMILIFSLFFLRITITQQLDPQNADYQKMEIEISKLDTQNQLLKDQIAEEESFTVIATKAAAMGFINRDNSILYITK